MTIAGVAWAPDRGVTAVELQIDDSDWTPATISNPISDATWVQFVHPWEATAGDHRISVRATDGDGVVQTDERTRPESGRCTRAPHDRRQRRLIAPVSRRADRRGGSRPARA